MTDAFSARWDEFRNLPDHPELSVFPDRTPRITHAAAVDSEYQFHCPHCKYNLRGTAGTYCPECGTHIEFEPVTVFTAADQSLVWVAAMLMDQHEISNLIVTGSYDPVIGVFTGTSSMPRLMVPHKFFFEAVDLLEKQFGQRVFKHGERPPAPTPQPPWTCPQCREESPGNFAICWNCGHARDVPAQ